SDYLHAVRADSPSCQRSTTGQPSPLHTHVLVRPTAFQSPELRESDARIEFQQIYQALTESVSRNAMICSDVISAVAAGRFPLVLTERTEHLTCLAQQLQRNIPHVITLKGGMSKNQILAALASIANLPQNEGRVRVATGKYIGEGFYEPRLYPLF